MPAPILDLTNTYIHGTSSQTLAMMSKTEFQLMSPIAMMEDYQIAPMVGELHTGGAFKLANGCMFLPAFAPLTAESGGNRSVYTLEKIVENYANRASQAEASSLEQIKADLENELERAKKRNYDNINVIAVYIGRYRQLGGDLREIPGIRSLEEDFKNQLNILYLYLLIATHIGPNPCIQELNSCGIGNLSNAVRTFFGVDQLLQKMKDNSLDLAAIYSHPSDENLKKVIKLFDLEKECTVKDWANRDKHVELELTSPFLINQNKESADEERAVDLRTETHYLLGGLVNGEYNQGSFYAVANNVRENIYHLNRRFEMIKSLLKCQKPFRFDAIEQEMFDSKFPIIFVSRKDKMLVEDSRTQEFRAISPLKLGEDIICIATNTYSNKAKIERFVVEKGLAIKVCTFDDLSEKKAALLGKPNRVLPPIFTTLSMIFTRCINNLSQRIGLIGYGEKEKKLAALNIRLLDPVLTTEEKRQVFWEFAHTAATPRPNRLPYFFSQARYGETKSAKCLIENVSNNTEIMLCLFGETLDAEEIKNQIIMRNPQTSLQRNLGNESTPISLQVI